jgi:hypothetical protein
VFSLLCFQERNATDIALNGAGRPTSVAEGEAAAVPSPAVEVEVSAEISEGASVFEETSGAAGGGEDRGEGEKKEEEKGEAEGHEKREDKEEEEKKEDEKKEEETEEGGRVEEDGTEDEEMGAVALTEVENADEESSSSDESSSSSSSEDSLDRLFASDRAGDGTINYEERLRILQRENLVEGVSLARIERRRSPDDILRAWATDGFFEYLVNKACERAWDGGDILLLPDDRLDGYLSTVAPTVVNVACFAKVRHFSLFSEWSLFSFELR